MKNLLFISLLFLSSFCFGQTKRSFVSSSEFQKQVAPHGYSRLITVDGDSLFSIYKAKGNNAVFKKKFSGIYTEHFQNGLLLFEAQMNKGNITGLGYFYHPDGRLKMKVVMLSSVDWVQRTMYNYDKDGILLSTTVHDLIEGTENTLIAE